MGKGVGDLNIKASLGTLSSETFSIEDCLKTYMNTYLNHYNDTQSATLNYNLPSTFKIEYEYLITKSSNNSCFFRIGETDSKALLVGRVGSNDTNYKIYARNGTDVISTGYTISISNEWKSLFMSYNGTTFNFNDDISITNFNGISIDKLLNCVSWKMNNYSGQIRNIKVKPL